MRARGTRGAYVLGVAVAVMLVLAACGQLATPKLAEPRDAALQQVATPGQASTQASEPTGVATGGASPGVAAGTQPAAGRAPQPYDATQLDPRVTQTTVGSTIGVSGWASRARPPSSVTSPIKRALMRRHGYDQPLRDFELDHFIPLGVGGSSNVSNLWLEPIAEARLKDRDEALVHKKVTSGEWTLARGQQYIRDHWTIHYSQ